MYHPIALLLLLTFVVLWEKTDSLLTCKQVKQPKGTCKPLLSYWSTDNNPKETWNRRGTRRTTSKAKSFKKRNQTDMLLWPGVRRSLCDSRETEGHFVFQCWLNYGFYSHTIYSSVNQVRSLTIGLQISSSFHTLIIFPKLVGHQLFFFLKVKAISVHSTVLRTVINANVQSYFQVHYY